MLTACSALPAVVDDQSEPPPPYDRIAAQHFKKAFKDYASYGGIEISGLRRVFYTMGWSWLACVRFEAGGHRRLYAYYIQQDRVVEARYAVQTDECGTQQYAPFDLGSGTVAPAAAPGPGPLY